MTEFAKEKASPEPERDPFVVGFSFAEGLFYEKPDRTNYHNPFQEGTEESKGFEEAVYIFTQK